MNKKLIVALVAVVVIAGGVWAYMAMQPNAAAPTKDTGSTSSKSTGKTSQPTSDTEITYTTTGFSPHSLTVKSGSTITIKNQSSEPLKFSSNDHPTHTLNTELNMATIDAGGEGSLEVKKVGTWGYHNHLNPSDMGTIVVTE